MCDLAPTLEQEQEPEGKLYNNYTVPTPADHASIMLESLLESFNESRFLFVSNLRRHRLF